MPSVAPPAGPIHLGLDVSKNKIAVGILRPDQAAPDVELIPHDEPSVRRLIDRFADRDGLRVCYEAGPTGFGLHRLLTSLGVACDVVAPAMVPRAPADRVKTDRRDARRLARLHRAGELVCIRVPTDAEEAVRDLCRARADLVSDRTRARHRLSKFLLRHDRVWRENAWTVKHAQWLAGQRFDQPALRATYAHYRGVLAARDAELVALEADLANWYRRAPFAEAVARLAAYRGVAELAALTIASEVADWRRFATARAFMGFTGLVPSEYSSGQAIRRGRITKAGNAHLRTQLIESAWAYQHHPSLGIALRRRQDGLPPATLARSWAAQQRLCSRYRRLAARKTSRNIVTVAIARELAGFLWAEMTSAQP
ncbi:MAG TPA: IS110 family transposase [Pseudonocardiaceae bacterium]|nr:IS110 family transposase [Pseudonocardiaceae bacterium]